MSPITRSVAKVPTKRSLQDASIDASKPAKIIKLSKDIDCKGDISPASGRSGEDKVSYEARFTPGHNLRRQRRLANIVPPSMSVMSTSAQSGLRNLTGDICYRSSFLQALLHQPQFCNFLTKYHEPDHCIWLEAAPCIACVLRVLVQAYWSGEKKLLDDAYKNVHRAFLANDWQNRQGGHHDPEEQMTWIFTKFSEQMPACHFAVFQAIANFTIDSSTTCTACGYVSSKLADIENALVVDLQPRIPGGNVANYLKQTLAFTVEGYRCDSCKDTKSVKERARKIAHSADILILHLKRFTPFKTKDSYPIPILEHLDLNRFRTPNNKAESEYELTSVILHSGSVGGGHCINMSRCPDGQWLRFDDSQASRILKEAVLTSGDKKFGFTPYLLFYQRLRK